MRFLMSFEVECLEFLEVIELPPFKFKGIVCYEAGAQIVLEELPQFDNHFELRLLVINQNQVLIQIHYPQSHFCLSDFAQVK